MSKIETPVSETEGGGDENPHPGKPTDGRRAEGDGPNAVARSDGSNGSKQAVGSSAPPYEPHQVSSGGQTFAVIETNGVAQAEATGKVGTDASYEREQESPGSG